MSLKGKIVWITGGKRIGKEIAEALLKEGANLVISYRSSKAEAEEFKDQAFIIQCDVSNRESVVKAVEEIKGKFGRLDILILLASIFKPIKLDEITEKDWQDYFSAHVMGTFSPIQLSLPIMPPGSHIITISDRTALGRSYPGFLPYVVTKGAIASMTKALAMELGPKGIFINSIAPGPVLKPADISDKDWQDIRNESIVKFPITDEEAVEEFVATVLRLAEVRSTGSVYPLDFGHL